MIGVFKRTEKRLGVGFGDPKWRSRLGSRLHQDPSPGSSRAVSVPALGRRRSPRKVARCEAGLPPGCRQAAWSPPPAWRRQTPVHPRPSPRSSSAIIAGRCLLTPQPQSVNVAIKATMLQGGKRRVTIGQPGPRHNRMRLPQIDHRRKDEKRHFLAEGNRDQDTLTKCFARYDVCRDSYTQ